MDSDPALFPSALTPCMSIQYFILSPLKVSKFVCGFLYPLQRAINDAFTLFLWMEDEYPLELDGIFSNSSSVTYFSGTEVPNLTVPVGIIVAKDPAQRPMLCKHLPLFAISMNLATPSLSGVLLRGSRHTRVTAGASLWHSVCPQLASQCHLPHLPHVTCIHTRQSGRLTAS